MCIFFTQNRENLNPRKLPRKWYRILVKLVNRQYRVLYVYQGKNILSISCQSYKPIFSISLYRHYAEANSSSYLDKTIILSFLGCGFISNVFSLLFHNIFSGLSEKQISKNVGDIFLLTYKNSLLLGHI